jgi:hypothetical protein
MPSASQIIVPLDTPGFPWCATPVMGERGGAGPATPRCATTDCRVPQTNRAGRGGRGLRIAQERLGPGRIHHCMRWIGICERAFEMMCRHANLRQVAPGRPLAEQQTIQNVGGRKPRRDQRRAAAGAGHGQTHRREKGVRRPRRHLADQVPRGQRAATRAGPGHPGAWRRWA